ncbi:MULTISPECIES: hypothetical protein [Staphylococcus]|uniref:hypothetical protein n=1 Tax=Staphylococcus TaxID=1279 RepID=UPI0015F94E7A|nr:MULTISPECIES: hypothetical protein [Staphylococcus]MCD8835064.1 hypothetical protein [Staphylococcus arlettae]
MEHRIDLSPERRKLLEQRIEEIKREDRELYDYQSEYRIVESNLHGMYIELVPLSER